MVFLGCVLVLIGIAFALQLKDNRIIKEQLNTQATSIETNRTLLQNKQIENEALRAEIKKLSDKIATCENELAEAKNEISSEKAFSENYEKLLQAYSKYLQNRKGEARELLSEVSPETVTGELFDILNNRLN